MARHEQRSNKEKKKPKQVKSKETAEASNIMKIQTAPAKKSK